MMARDLLLLLHVAFCLALLWSIFDRFVRCSRAVKADVRFAFWLLGIVACLGLAAPLSLAWSPDLFTVALLGAVVLVQMVTAHHWRCGVPDRFIKPGQVPRNRRAGDVT